MQLQSEKHSHLENESIVLHFGTKPHEIDSKTLLESLGGIEIALMQIAQQGHPDTRFRIKIKPFQKGTFNVPIELQTFLLSTGLALTSPDWASARESIKILIELIKLKMIFKGKKPKIVRQDGDNIEIKKNSKCTINIDRRTYNFFTKDSVISDGITRSFNALQNDTEIKSFAMLNKKKEKLLAVPRKSFQNIIANKKEVNERDQKLIERLELPIFKPVLAKNKASKWELYYRGIKVSAAVEDESFLNRVHDGERFGRGDTLDAELEISKHFDKKANTFINKSYKIVRVFKIHRGQQQEEF